MSFLPMAPGDTVQPHVVILVHGIRDFALWQTTVRSALEDGGFKVEAINYGRFNLLRFLAPFSYFRKKAIATVWNQIRIVKQNNEGSRLSVIAHSFGTFVVAQLMLREFDIKFHRVIFCGSVVRYGFPFEQFQDRFAQPIVNEVGTRDVWPAIAESITTGYGSAGTYGFRRPLVRDRWHNGARHGFFLDADFCRRFWSPLLRDGTFVAGAVAPEPPRLWLRLLSIFKIKYVVLALALLLYAQFLQDEAGENFRDQLGPVRPASRIAVPDPRTIGTVEDLAVALRQIESRKSTLNRDEIKQVSTDLTRILLPNDGAIPRVTRRGMNQQIVGTLVFLNNRDLSYVWRDLPENLDLSALDLRNLNLRGVRFQKAFLINTTFGGSVLDDVAFDTSWVLNVDFYAPSLSEISFVDSDWFNARNLSNDRKDGQPIPYHTWLQCPEGYKSADHRPFIQMVNRLYATKFNEMRPQDAAQLIDWWTFYAKDDGLCDRVLRWSGRR